MPSYFLFFACVRLSSPESVLGPKTAAIVRSIPVRVNVKQLATPGENISVMDDWRNIAIALIDPVSSAKASPETGVCFEFLGTSNRAEDPVPAVNNSHRSS